MAALHRSQEAASWPGTVPAAESTPYVQRLHAELVQSERRLNEALAKVTSTSAELRASNDDQRCLNEELSTANEELAASESELQALNSELAGHVEELAEANAAMRGVIDSTRIAIVFLDASLRIRSFTPAVQGIVNIRAADRGRPITDLVLQVDYTALASDARQVLADHRTLERRAAHSVTGAQYLIRLLPYRARDEQVAGIVVTFLDITATVEVEQALRASDDRFRRIAASVPALLFIAGPDMAWEYVNPPFYELTGQPEGSALGDGWLAVLHPDETDANRALWRQAQADGVTVEHEARLRRADDTWCWFLIRAVPELDPAGQVLRWYGSCTDIDERRLSEKHQGMLLAELQHRIKNILAVVRSVLTRTLESSSDIDHFATHLAGRIGALARTQSVAACTPEGGVMLEDLVYQELASHGGQDERQVQVEGPLVKLPAKIADTLGLTIHELATNSIKYGALAVPTGRVEVRWEVGLGATDADRCLSLEWRETGVPLTDLNPKRRGFGRELIEQGLPYELGAVTELQFRPGGLHCSITLNLPDPAASRLQQPRWV